MKFKLALFLFSMSFYYSAFAIDVGDGSDGDCVTATFQIVPTKRYYQCATLTISSNLTVAIGVPNDPLVIKVQGLVTINSNIFINGADGNAGGGATQSGGSGGTGGNDGGKSNLGNGDSGDGLGAGGFGKYVSPGTADSYGGGGGGGSYNINTGLPALDGDDVGGPGNGLGSGGSTGAVPPGNETTFETSFVGGSGGAAGGGGKNGGVSLSGSSGGGGGGALRIIAGGDMIINGIISSNGGNGGGVIGTTRSGGGGGGSGGAIWLQAAGDITGAGAINAIGGTHGTNDAGLVIGFPAGDGGDGSDGRIRLDDRDGVVALAASPSSYSTTFTPTALSSGTSAISRQYASAIACGRVSLEHEPPFNNLINLILGLMITSTIYFSISRKGKI